MLSITETSQWRVHHPGAAIGLLELSGVDNTQAAPQLDGRKREIEAHLRRRYRDYTRQDFLALPVMAAYRQYYKRFDKTYHVQLQVESIVLKGKNLPNVSPMVDANFMAEMETFVLAAGHDVTRLQEPVLIDVSQVGDQIRQMSGENKTMAAGDMVMRDAEGVSCSIIYGQDNRSPISPATTRVLYVVYAPEGVPVDVVNAHLGKIEEHVRIVSPHAMVEQQRVITAT
jgi:DNA/RNA-binding domain of Phe-tRNA-synthetase-like protein